MSKSEILYSVIKKRILNEDYSPGSKISETLLAEEFNCSRTPVRQVLQQLANENLLDIIPKSGTYIKERTTIQKRADTQVRAYLEGLCFRLCLERQDSIEPLINKMTLMYEEMNKHMSEFSTESMAEYTSLHYRFHRELIIHSENPLASKFFNDLNLVESPSFLKKMTIEDIIRTKKEHAQIITDLKNRDPDGERRLIDHLYHKII